MSSDDLCYMSASEAIKQFRALSLSPVELLDAIIDRAESGYLRNFWKANY